MGMLHAIRQGSEAHALVQQAWRNHDLASSYAAMAQQTLLLHESARSRRRHSQRGQGPHLGVPSKGVELQVEGCDKLPVDCMGCYPHPVTIFLQHALQVTRSV